MLVQENVSLKPFNSFGIDVIAKQFAVFRTVAELNTILSTTASKNPLVLGGGSNLLFTRDIEGLVIRNQITGFQKMSEDDDSVIVKAGAGQNWHGFVLECIKNGWGGVENLSLIPGCVGASPMQNIGAYGVEIKDVFHELTAFNLDEKSNYTFRAKDCEFGYRESVFKRKYKNSFVITDVSFRLSKKPVLNTSYGAIEQELASMGVKEPTIKTISDAVIRIRSSKLPDPKEIGNAGSFFKNPSIGKSEYDTLKQEYPGLVGYDNPDGTVKLAAGWLIEQCGWKGYRRGDAGCHEKQALVLVNYGNASGQEIYDLSEEILRSVQAKFNVTLEREVNIL